MVRALATFYVKEGKIDEFLVLAKELIDTTNAKDKGCIEYKAFSDERNSNIVWFIEKWRTKEDLNLHLQSEHVSRIIPKIGLLLTQNIAVHILEPNFNIKDGKL